MLFKDKFGNEFYCDYNFSECDTLVISGGALKCLYPLGALCNVDCSKFKFFAGTSCGAIIVALIMIGYSPFRIFQQFIRNEHIVLTETLSKVIEDLELMFEEKNFSKNISFRELENRTGKKIAFIASNVSKLREEIFSGVSHPNAPVITAIKMSCSLPIIFPIAKYENDIFTDGIFFDNFPIKLSRLFNHKCVLALTTLNSYYDNRMLEFYASPNIYKIVFIPESFSKYFYANRDQKFCMFISGYNFVRTNQIIKKQQTRKRRLSN